MCDFVIKLHHQQRKHKELQMNAKQTQMIEKIKSLMLAKESLGGLANVEIKSQDLSENEYFVSFSITVGRLDDENTMASVYCRDYRHFFIGKKGGVKLVSVDNNGKFKSPSNVHGLANAISYLPF